MRASRHQVREAAVGAVEVARHRASDVVGGSAEHLGASIERGAKVLEGGIDRAAEVLPIVSVEVVRRRRRSRRPLVLVLLVLVGACALVWFARRRRPSSTASEASEVSEVSEEYHVVPASGGGWDLTAEPTGDVISHHDTQAQGVERATELAAGDGGGEVVIHGLDGEPRDTKRVASS
jgi:hypothetical protein